MPSPTSEKAKMGSRATVACTTGSTSVSRRTQRSCTQRGKRGVVHWRPGVGVRARQGDAVAQSRAGEQSGAGLSLQWMLGGMRRLGQQPAALQQPSPVPHATSPPLLPLVVMPHLEQHEGRDGGGQRRQREVETGEGGSARAVGAPRAQGVADFDRGRHGEAEQQHVAAGRGGEGGRTCNPNPQRVGGQGGRWAGRGGERGFPPQHLHTSTAGWLLSHMHACRQARCTCLCPWPGGTLLLPAALARRQPPPHTHTTVLVIEQSPMVATASWASGNHPACRISASNDHHLRAKGGSGLRSS